MKNKDLDNLIKAATVPEPTPGFWDDLPAAVRRESNRAQPSVIETPTVRRLFPAFLRPLAFATICIAIGFIWGNSRRSTLLDSELSEAQIVWTETASLFPNQLQSIVIEKTGMQVNLSDLPNQTIASPIFLKLCAGNQCSRFITFSGQQIQFNGEQFEVLVDHRGEVLLVVANQVWISSSHSSRLGEYRVAAQRLQNS